ncbi:MAG: OmpA family protein [Treponema sp.]|jgi:outer membrane protein OmpA-like peptidoglycan-associated protein|nr:OmpA family protein [Treponema sp.]
MKKMKIAGAHVLFTILGLLGTLSGQQAFCEEFVYKYQDGDRYRILSVVKESVYIDRRLSHTAEILNRIAVEVIAVNDGKGRHKAVFQTSERTTGGSAVSGSGAGRSFQWSREYESEFERDRLGIMAIDSKYYMPVVRNVPVFPGRNLLPGEKWSAEGHEMHDFRDSFGIAQPYCIPFTANYTFIGDRQWKGKTYPAFSVSYRILSEPQAVRGRVWPRSITGASDQIVYWDFNLGQAVAYEEQFRMVFQLSDGRTVEYRGSAEAEILESPDMDKNKIAEEISEEISRLNIPNADVRVVDEGITISLEDIMFRADSPVMLPGEREKLDRIAEILLRYPDRDIMVSGHTAMAGTPEGRMKLSTERAAAVADYLAAKKVRSADRIIVRGFGAEKPIADNRTPEGMQKNRRVEITILEN